MAHFGRMDQCLVAGAARRLVDAGFADRHIVELGCKNDRHGEHVDNERLRLGSTG